ncbi:MAG TPA: glycosyltransferase family 2 protein [Tepidisphaeraceae bacterium]|jgi:glycosyltransferase involved in cell wall biosynthesis|nr:glycosyltransferase family 2 protein [Tepidisphaeraceae bacterium]
MNLPKISIVTPSYNQGPYIGWTARSVFLQRYPNLEYVMMDGGSKDNTMEELQPYADRFAHISSERDKGQADAIARGFLKTSGEIMAYLNSDDMLSPGTLHWVAKYFADHPDVDAVYSHRCTVDSNNKVIWYWILPEHDNYKMMRWDLIPQETCFWRRRIYDKVGNVDPSYRFAMDYDLFARIMRDGKMVRANRFLGVFREHEVSKTSTQMTTVGAEEVRRVQNKYGLTFKKWDWLRSARFYNSVIRNGCKFANARIQLPGNLPGVGYDYDEVWGGLLGDGRLAPRVAG